MKALSPDFDPFPCLSIAAVPDPDPTGPATPRGHSPAAGQQLGDPA